VVPKYTSYEEGDPPEVPGLQLSVTLGTTDVAPEAGSKAEAQEGGGGVNLKDLPEVIADVLELVATLVEEVLDELTTLR
jgi:hypothetical protein